MKKHLPTTHGPEDPIPTARLLFRCLRSDDTFDKKALIEQQTDEQWNDLLSLSERNSVSPLLYHTFRKADLVSVIPEQVGEKLRTAYYLSGKRNTLLYHYLKEALRSLTNAGIPVILLKGAHFAESIYGNIALRPMGDLDLMVRKEDISGVKQTFRAMGYTQKWPVVPTPDEVENPHHLPPFTRERSPVFEMHWTLGDQKDPFQIDFEGIWQRAQSVRIANSQVLTLSIEDLLLYLCLHTVFQHRLSTTFMPFCDMERILHHFNGAVDWQALLRRSGQWGVNRCCYTMFQFAQEFLGTQIPPHVQDALRPSDPAPGLLDDIWKYVLSETPPGLRLATRVDEIKAQTTVTGKAGLFFRRLFPRRKAISSMYLVNISSMKLYWYYLVRLKTLFRRHGKLGMQLLKGDATLEPAIKHEMTENAFVDWLRSGD